MKRTLAVAMFIILSALSSSAEEAVVARVNNAAITAADLEAAIDSMIPRAAYHRNVGRERRNELRESALDNLIDHELAYQDAVSRDLKPDRKYVKAKLAEVRGRFDSTKAFKAALKKAGMTEDELEAQAAKESLVQVVFNKTVVEPSRVADTALREYYSNNIDKFKQPESVKLRIFSSKDEKKAGDALAKVKAGENFADVASALSEDQYRVMGGDIGYQHRGKLLPEIEQEAFKLRPGETSGLIHAADFWFLIKVEDKKPEHQMTFDESRDKLRKELELKRSRELQNKWFAELRAKAKIELLLKPELENDGGQTTKETTTQHAR